MLNIDRLQAWSRIVHTLIPNANVLSRHLTIVADACSATEVVMFERTTFLVIATSEAVDGSELLTATATATAAPAEQQQQQKVQMDATRYERTSEL